MAITSRKSPFLWTAGAIVAASAVLGAQAQAADLVMGMKNPPLSVDPHYYTSPTALQVNIMIFEPMVKRNDDSGIDPWLAESWTRENDTTWVFKIRQNVKFHDGSPLTSEDIAFTYTRARSVPNSPTSFSTYLAAITEAKAVDPYTLRITTKDPAPLLLENLANVLIVSKKNGEKATTEEYNNGKATIGTGPYKFLSFAVNDSTVLARNPDYWGPKEPWDKVTYKIMPNDPPRLAALLAGDVDMIETVPTQDLERLKSGGQINMYSRPSSRVLFLAIDTGDAAISTEKLTGPNGEKLDKNPLADVRVRRAMKLALDLDTIGARIFQGEATATGQMVLPNVPGYSPNVKPWKANPDEARKLMEASGWAGKFKLDLSVATTIFPNAVQTSEVLAQQWTRIGIPTKVSQTPYAVFVKAQNERTMPVYFQSYQNSNGSAGNLYVVLTHSRDVKAGVGGQNFLYYSNPELDKALDEGLRTLDDDKRAKLMERVGEINDADSQMVPLWLLGDTTGTKKTVVFKPRADRHLYPTHVRPAGAAAAAK